MIGVDASLNLGTTDVLLVAVVFVVVAFVAGYIVGASQKEKELKGK